MNLVNIRGWQFERMELGLKTVMAICATADLDNMLTYRDGGEGWTVLEVLCHLRDFEGVFFERARLTVNEDNPALPFPNPDELAVANNYQDEDLVAVLEAWKHERNAYLKFLRDRAETDWERVAQHPTRGDFTLHDQLFLTTLHDGIHTEQITHILAEEMR